MQLTNRPPEWFAWALGQPQQSHFVDSGGTRIHYISWNAGDKHKPSLLFAHGFLGHCHWWDFIAPFFTENFRVFALDFSGMGQSGHRAAYSGNDFVADLSAVLTATQVTGSAAGTVVGHSFGGTTLLQACVQVPDLIRHAIVLDSLARFRGEEQIKQPQRSVPRPYADEATLRSHFHLLPEQDCAPWTLEHVTGHSIHQVPGGWTWRFDPMLRQIQAPEVDPDLLGEIAMPVDYVHAEVSKVVSAERARHITRVLPRGRGPIAMPCAGHHLMLDQPLALIGVLRALLARAY